MEAQNVYDLIVSEKPRLAAKLNENENVSAFLMAVYSQLLYIAIDSKNDPKEMICIVDIVQKRLLRIRVDYYKKAPKVVDIGDKLPVKRNINLVSFLQVNRNVRDLAMRVVEILEKWVRSHPASQDLAFSSLKILEGRLVRGVNNVFTGELVIHMEWEDFVNKKLKWNLDEEGEIADAVEKGQVTI